MRGSASKPNNSLKVIVFFVLLIGLLIALYLAKNPTRLENRAAAPRTATLSMTANPATTTVGGSSVVVNVNLNTGASSIRGVDVKINFDKTKLRLTAVTPGASGTTLQAFAPVTSTNTFDSATVVTNANNNGYVEFGAVTANLSSSTVTSAYTSSNASILLATLTFSPIAAGTNIAINFDPSTNPATNLTTDTNVVSDTNPPEDILNGVTNTVVTINSSTSISCAIYDFGGTVGTIDITDVQKVAAQFNKAPVAGSTDKYDFDKNNIINIADIQNIAGKWNQACQ